MRPVNVAVVTGGSSGIGAAIARRLAQAGWDVVLLARNRERLEQVATELGAEYEVCDVGDRERVDEVAARIGMRHDAVHLLVNNAGIPGGGRFLEVPPERIEEVTRTNYLGSVWALRAFLPLLERGTPSDVVNVVSIAGTVVAATSGPYAASKHAQLAFSRAITAELAPRGIRVHSVNPGPVPTPGFPQRRLVAGPISRQVVVSPDRVARAVMRALERDRREIFIPGVFRLAALGHAVAPGLVGRVASARRWRR